MTRVYQMYCLLGVMMLCHITPVVAADDVHVSEVASGIFVFQGVHEQMSLENLGAISNSGFIVGERSVAVIDSGGSPEFGKLLRRALERVTDLPVEYLILTHFHPDHVAGSTAFPEAMHVVAHDNYARAMTQRAQFYLERFARLLPGGVPEVFRLPTQEVPAGQTIDIDLGGRSLTIEAHALAHTDNDITVHDRQTNTLWASDLVFAGRTPSLDGSLKGWLKAMSVLDERDYGLTIPGHGTPAPWSELLAPQTDYLLRLNDDVRQMIDQGMALSEVLERHDADGDNDSAWALYAVQHGSNLAKAYAELEWE